MLKCFPSLKENYPNLKKKNPFNGLLKNNKEENNPNVLQFKPN